MLRGRILETFIRNFGVVNMELLSFILVCGFLRGLYYIFKEARNENIIFRIACFWLNLMSLFGALCLIGIFGYNPIISKKYFYGYIIVGVLLLLYGGYLRASTEDYNKRSKYVKDVIEILILIGICVILEFFSIK